MEQINCPVCTLLNPSTNTNCDVCDSPLVEGDNTENKLEDEFMALTGESRSKAQEYLKVSNNELDKALGFYYEDKELGVTNSQYMNTQNLANEFLELLTSTLRIRNDKPKDIRDLTCQMLYGIGKNKPHYCEICDSRASLCS